MKFVIFCMLSVNFYTSLSLTFYRNPYYSNVLGTIGVNAGQCTYVGDQVNDRASSAKWTDSANFNRCICFYDHYNCSGRTRCWDEGNRFFENFGQQGISNMVSGVSLYNNDPNTSCSARNRD